MPAVRGGIETSHARPIGVMSYIGGVKLRQGTPCLNLLKIRLLVESAVSFRCLQNWWKWQGLDLHAPEEEGVKLPTHSCVSGALAHRYLSAPSAYCWISMASAYSCKSMYGIGVGCLFACGARGENVTFGYVIKHLTYNLHRL